MVLLTVATEDGATFSVDVGLDMELENLMALLEADSSIPVDDQLVFHNGRRLTGFKESLDSYGVKENDMLLLRQKSNDPASSQQAHVAGRNIAQDAETMRRQVLGNPQVMADLRRTNPELADAAQNDPARFRDLLGQLAAMQESARLQREREMQLLEADPFDVEAQKKIEEAIRQERVLENMEQAMEDMPESFGQVHMLYMNVEVNGVPVKAFVDSGAQRTIMSPSCAERCGIMRLIDTRFAGMAQGVGTGKILGRVHSAQLKMADLYLQCSFTILESKSVDLLFGLDMLKRHQCCIDLRQDALVIQDRKVPFLPEHEIPKGELQEYELDANGNPVPVGTVDSSLSNASAAAGPSAPSTSSAAATSGSSFPGSGRTLGQSPNASPNPKRVRSSSPSAAPSSAAQPASSTGLPNGINEEAVQSLVGLGATRAQAISLLEAAGGNAEVAASLLFSG
ncbi:DNA damage-inducible protein 1 [Rhodotorula toruloides]|uniref:DNA damage-inducible protein 1 n=1 Tax=Rhodotorula toruloides TaxID=5286 RepID=A0A0K3C6L5_RHOTO|nr:DNA damage-inducible protein 1 [Rhodotorula toruloides]